MWSPPPDPPLHHRSNPLTHMIQSIFSYDGNVMLAAIISLLLVILFVLLLHVYAKWFLAQAHHHGQTRSLVSVSTVLGQTRFHHFHSFTVDTDPCTKGLDPSIVASLPLFVCNNGLECVICLTVFEDEDIGRKLPKCGHVFHVECIDMWLHSHTSCPICRASLVPEEEEEEDTIANDAEVIGANREEMSESEELGVTNGESDLEIIVDVQSCENENIAPIPMNEPSSTCSASSSSSSLSRASSLSGSLKRMLSGSRSECKIHPSSVVVVIESA